MPLTFPRTFSLRVGKSNRFSASLSLLAICLAGSILSGCGSSKKKNVGWLGKGYHNMTSRYNGYFNADVLMQESILKLRDQHQDNYNRILDVYDYVDVENPQAISGDVDKAIKKATVNINIHRPSHWVDDEYLLIGQAQYLKHDYETAENTFKFFVQEFNPAKRRGKASRASVAAGLKNSTDKRAQQKAKELEKKEAERQKAEEREIREEQKEAKAKQREELQEQRQKTAKEKKRERERMLKERKKIAKKNARNRQKSGSNARVNPQSPKVAKPDSTRNTKIATLPDPKKEPAAKETAKTDDKLPAEEKPMEYTPDSYFMKHRPAFQSGLVWMARNLIERKKYNEAVYLLKSVQENPKAFKDVRQQAAVAEAHAWARQGEYNNMIEPLERAIPLTKKKKERARYAFIIGQIHQQQGRYADAARYYKQAIRYRPAYDMEFRSRLNMILSAQQSGAETADNANSKLQKMLKDDKNKEYRDQIYYTLGMIELKNGNQVAAIEQFKKSTASPGDNKAQRAETFYELARLSFDMQQFVNAKLYYDSTLQVMAKTDPRFAESNRYSKNLMEIALNLQIISLQDSLLRVSEMSDADKKALAKQLKKERETKAAVAAAATPAPKAKGANALPSVSNNPVNIPTASTSSSFFAYDDKVLKRGMKDFEDTWGPRKLEDNWRRSNRANANAGSQDIAAVDSAQVDPDDISSVDLDDLLKEVPKSPSEVAAANSKIMNALFKLGQLYRDKLQDNPNAIKSLEELLRRYPTTVFDEEAYYLLYLAHSEEGHAQEANMYREKIIKKNPESKFAQAITDPAYLQKLGQKEDLLEKYYQETFTLFSESRYDSAFSRSQESVNLFGKSNRLQAKFALLSAMCIGNLQGRDPYINALQDVVAKYPNTKEETRAKEILRLLGQKTVAEKDTIQNDPKKNNLVATPYTLDPKINHFIIVVITGKNLPLDQAKVTISDYNRKFHSLEDIRITNIALAPNTNTNVIILRKFDNKDAAMKYYDEVQRNRKDFIADATQYEMYAISQDNYKNLLKARSYIEYREFFLANYLQ